MDIEVLTTMQTHSNICNHIHLPVQSGSDKILKAMNRQHSREEYYWLHLVLQFTKLDFETSSPESQSHNYECKFESLHFFAD